VIVVDASAVLELLLNSPAGLKVAERVFADGESLHAPHVLDLEVAQVLRRYTAMREMPQVRANDAMRDFLDLPINRYAHADLLPRIWELHTSLSAYDAAYVSLAESLDAQLLTCDGKLARAHGHEARVDVIS
jgi:predicted nucleic acid-binding protein